MKFSTQWTTWSLLWDKLFLVKKRHLSSMKITQDNKDFPLEKTILLKGVTSIVIAVGSLRPRLSIHPRNKEIEGLLDVVAMLICVLHYKGAMRYFRKNGMSLNFFFLLANWEINEEDGKHILLLKQARLSIRLIIRVLELTFVSIMKKSPKTIITDQDHGWQEH
ncbi:hypothetical protein Cgig2_021381 [Carnegiea gigantea]|uniref:FAR1-related sequence 11-like HTH-like domain-containing protein n=1 Tax=Carnegiea gigantea TaxID=171969 RepID=A0A9Q1KDW0_9CARY|nr:hypothetical protein Cgig2_021381 [Carnegiea gigantea]